MGNYAVVKAGVIVNVVVWNGSTPWTPAADETVVAIPSDQPAGIGWTYDGSVFAAPAA